MNKKKLLGRALLYWPFALIGAVFLRNFHWEHISVLLIGVTAFLVVWCSITWGIALTKDTENN